MSEHRTKESGKLTYEGGYDGFGTRAAMAQKIADLKAERDALREQLNASAEQNVIARAERDALRERLSHAEAYIPSRDFADYLGDSGK